MNRWLNRANKRVSLGNAAALLVGATLIGQVLGFLRTQIVNANFPAYGPQSTDAYFAAFKIPDLFFYTIAAGALGVAFMPFLADKLQSGDKKAVWNLTNSLLNLLMIFMFIIGIILFVFAEPLIRLIISNDMSPEQLHNTTMIMKLLSFDPLIFSISGILSSLQQTFGRFFFYATAPIVYNGSIIASAYVFRDNIGLIGLGIGALAGAILQLLVVILGLVGMKYRYRPIIDLKSPDFRRMIRQVPPRSVDQGIDSINSIVETNRARTLGESFISKYENAFILHMAPILLIGNTIATAAFPRLNDRLAAGRPDLFRRDFFRVLRVMIWIILPIVVISFFGRGFLARLIYKNNAPEIALIFGFLTAAILFRTVYALISRYFYSHKDTMTPLIVSVFAIALNIYLAFIWVKTYGVQGLGMAQSTVAAVEVAALVAIMKWRERDLFPPFFWSGVIRTLSVTGFTVMTAYIMVQIFPLEADDRGFITLGSKLAAIALPTVAVHIGLSALFGLEEVKPVFEKAKKLIFKPVRIQ